MNTPKTKPCTAIHDGIPCGGEMTFEPRQLEVRPTLNDPIGEQGSDPCWACDTCDCREWVDDDPGTASMFGEGEVAMSKHTPGEWAFGASIAYGRDLYAGSMWIGSIHGPHLSSASPGDFPTEQECEANASLIAAAPDLLVACEAALSELGSFCHAYGVDHEIQPAMVQLRAAIAKAHGTT